MFTPPRSSWPQRNEQEETALREALLNLRGEVPATAREAILELERTHGERRAWVWTQLGRSPLAQALAHLTVVAKGTASALGGASATELAKRYAEDAWQVDLAALESMAAAKSNADAQAVGEALKAIYGPWLEAAARHLQQLVEAQPLAYHEESEGDQAIQPGTVVLFADGLRFDVSQRLVQRLAAADHVVAVSTRWAALPSVTATAKPACSPIAGQLEGNTLGEDFCPNVWQPGNRFQQIVSASYSMPQTSSISMQTPPATRTAKRGRRTANSTSSALGASQASIANRRTGRLVSRTRRSLAGSRLARSTSGHRPRLAVAAGRGCRRSTCRVISLPPAGRGAPQSPARPKSKCPPCRGIGTPMNRSPSAPESPASSPIPSTRMAA